MRDMRQAFGATVSDLLERGPARRGRAGGDQHRRTSSGRWQRTPTRVVDVGIMEQTMVGVAAGFAMEGFHPIAHSLSPFMAERPYEQLKLDFGYQGLGGTFVGVGGSYDYAASGGTHHSPADAGVMLGIPGMEVLVPGHGDEVDQLLRSSYANGRPTYLRASVTTNAEAHEVGPGRIEVAPPRRRRDGASRSDRCSTGRSRRARGSTSRSPTRRACARSSAEGLVAIAGEAPVMVTVEPFYEGTRQHRKNRRRHLPRARTLKRARPENCRHYRETRACTARSACHAVRL